MKQLRNWFLMDFFLLSLNVAIVVFLWDLEEARKVILCLVLIVIYLKGLLTGIKAGMA